MSTVSSSRSFELHHNRLVRRGITATILALLAVGVVRSISVSISPELAPLDPFRWGPVIFVTVVAAIAGTAAFALLDRRENGKRLFVVLAVLVFLMSLFPIAFGASTIPGMSTEGLWLLGVMHLVASTAIVVSLLGLVRGLPA